MTQSILELLDAQPLQPARAPLLFVHGAYAAAWCWQDHYLPYFAEQGHPSFAVSLRGHGRSGGGQDLAGLPLADYLDDVMWALKTVRHRCGRMPVLVGHSMGAFLALAVARRVALTGLVLLAPVPPHGTAGAAWQLWWRSPSLWWSLTLYQSGLFTPPLDALRRLLLSPTVPDEQVQSIAARLQRESDRALADLAMPLPNARPLRGHPPVWVGGSRDDVLIPPDLTELTATTLDTPALLVEGLGHLVMLDQGWEKLAAPLATWLEAF